MFKLWEIDHIKAGVGIDFLVKEFYNDSKKAGWWDKGPEEFGVIPTKIALIHSEISEALEGHRKNKMDDHLPQRKAIEVELADAVIRIFDLAGALGLELGDAIIDKHSYNLKREDHKLENRAKENGKKY